MKIDFAAEILNIRPDFQHFKASYSAFFEDILGLENLYTLPKKLLVTAAANYYKVYDKVNFAIQVKTVAILWELEK